MATRALDYDDIFALREASDPSLRSDGCVAFVVSSADRDADENRSAIWTVRPGAEPSPLTHGTSDRAPHWSPDGTALSFHRKGANDRPQIWILPTRGGEAKQLTHFANGVTTAVWSPDSRSLAVTALVDIDGDPEDDKEKERRKTAPIVVRTSAYKGDGAGLFRGLRPHLHVVDVESGEATPLSKGDVIDSFPIWSPDGKHIVYVESRSDRDETGRAHLMRVSKDGGGAEEIADWEGTTAAPVFTPDGKTVVFAGASSVGTGHTRLYSVDAEGGRPDELLPDFDRNIMLGGPAYPGALPSFTANGTLVYLARDRGCTHVYATIEATKIIGGDERVVSGASVNGYRIAYVVSAPGMPADVFIADADGSNEQRLTDLNGGWLADVGLHRPVAYSFAAPDGTDLHGWVIGAPGVRGAPGKKDHPKPLLVDVHGGPHNAWSPAFDAVHIYHQVLADDGWAVLILNPRGSDGYGEAFYKAVAGGWGINDEQDFTSAIDTLVEHGIADPDRLAVCGYSYGGYMTNWLTAHTDLFKAAMSGGTVSDLTSIYGTSDLGYWMGKYEHGGELHEARERFAESSPLSAVENVTTPTLILHGESDDRCPIGQAEQWFTSLRRIGCETEFVRYPGASHLFILNGRPSHRIDYNRRITEWMTSHVEGT